MPTGQPFRTVAEVQAHEAQFTAAQLAALIADGRLWPIGEQRLDETTGRIEYWDGSVWRHYMVEPFTKGAAIISPTGPIDTVIWRAPFNCEVENVRAYQTGGATGSTFNARRNGTAEHLATDGTLSALGTWIDGGAVQNIAYVEGDSLEVRLKSVGAPRPDQVTIQVRFEQTP